MGPSRRRVKWPKSPKNVVGFGNAGVYVALSNGDGTFQPVQLAIDNLGYDDAAGGWRVDKNPRFLADLTGDGRANIVGFGNAGVYVARSNSAGGLQPVQLAIDNLGYDDGAGGWRVDKNPRFLADLTGDGRANIVGFGNAGVYVALSNGDGTFHPVNLAIDNLGYDDAAGGWRVDKNPRFLANITGDGRANIVGFGNAGVYVALSNGAGTFQPVQLAIDNLGYDDAAGGWRVDKNPRFLADLTGDGRANIVGFGNAGVYVARSNSAGGFLPVQLAIDDLGYDDAAGGWRVDKNPRFLADLTGDGRANIVGFGNAGVYVALSNGDGTFHPVNLAIDNLGYDDAAGGWRVDKNPRFLADLTGDGRADIVGFGNAGVYVALSNGDGTFQPIQLAIDNLGYDDAAGGWRVDKNPRLLADIGFPLIP